jgi:drug/metabolite transporter (DMT)-like permease
LIWLLPSAGCSIAIAVILKINEQKKGNRILIAGANYILASVLALVLLKGEIVLAGRTTMVLGTLGGVDFVLGFLLLMTGLSRGPMAVPVTVMRISVAVPIVVSIFLWGETPAFAQWIGIWLGLTAIVIFGAGLSGFNSGSGREGRYWLLIVSLFLVMGAGDVILKACRELSPRTERILFAWILFTVSAILCWILVWVRKVKIKRDTFLLGLLLGVPNLFSTIFTLKALESVPASVVFPFINLAVILGSTMLGYLVWKEHLSRMGMVGLALAAVSVVLLPMGK